jgi:hypothetical protein
MVFVTRDGRIVYSLGMPAGEGGGTSRRISLHETIVGGHGVAPAGTDPVPSTVSFFRGNDPAKWRTGISAFGSIDLGEAYDRIGVELIAAGRNVEKVFHVKPGGDPGGIRLRIAGGGGIAVDGAGELVLATEFGPVRFTRPLAWQERDGEKAEVPVAYRILDAGAGEYGFEVAAYDRSKELVIDPLLASTYLGGSISDFAFGAAFDADGNVYVVGTTESPDFPITPGAIDNALTSTDPGYDSEVFVSKFDRNLTTLLASTFLGGGRADYGFAVALDNSGNVVVAGATDSDDFPAIAGSYDNTYGGVRSAYVARLSGDLTTLLASTFLGGATGAQEAKALVVAADGAVFVVGQTSALDFPVTPGAPDNTLVRTDAYNPFDGFISKFSGNLSTLMASTYLGGDRGDQVFSIALGTGGNVYVAGYTESPDFPTTPGTYDNTFNGTSGNPFVAELNGTLTRILASTFLGSTYYSYIYEPIAPKQGFPVAVAADGSVYVAGATSLPQDFPVTPGSFDNAILAIDSPDGFVSRLDGGLTVLLASTFLRGGSSDAPSAVVVDPAGNVYVAGWTASSNFPSTPGAFDNTGAAGFMGDGFVSRLDRDLSHLLASTFLGSARGNDFIMPNALALDVDGNVYVVGATSSDDFPVTPGAYAIAWNVSGAYDAFVSKFSPTLSAFDPVISMADSVPPIRDRNVPLGNVTVGMAASGTVTVENIGNLGLAIGTIGSGNPLAAPFAVASDNCSGRTVAPGGSCTFDVRFSPVAQGDFLDTFDIPSNDPGTPSVVVTVGGIGVVPDILISDTIPPANDRGVPFGDVELGNEATATVTVTNVAAMNNAILLAGAVGGTDPPAIPFTVMSDNCSGRALSPSEGCSVVVRFRPLAGGPFTDTLDIPSNDPDTPNAAVSLSGFGAVPDIRVTDSVPPADDNGVRFGAVVRDTVSEQTVTVVNIGRANLVVGTVGGVDPLAAPFGIGSDNCSGRTLPPTASCAIAVRFSPAAIGEYSDHFDIPSNDPDSPTVPVGVSGSGRVFPDPVPTPYRVLLTGSPTVNGAALSEGDEIAVWSVHPKPSGGNRWEKVAIAHGIVGAGGALDNISVYGDDPGTTAVVEGAAPGEELCLVLWRSAENKEYTAYTTPAGLPAAFLWTSDGDSLPADLDFREGQRIPLRMGAWNLISYGILSGYYRGASPPGPPVAGSQISGVAWDNVAALGDAFPLKSIEGKVDRVVGNDGKGNKLWMSSIPASTLAYLAPGYGYWVRMKAGSTPLSWMTVLGSRATLSETLSLSAGWTLLGYWDTVRVYHASTYDASWELVPVDASPVPLSTLGEMWGSLGSSYDRMVSFDGGGNKLYLPSMPGPSTMKYLAPGYGYWGKMSGPVTLSYPPPEPTPPP